MRGSGACGYHPRFAGLDKFYIVLLHLVRYGSNVVFIVLKRNNFYTFFRRFFFRSEQCHLRIWLGHPNGDKVMNGDNKKVNIKFFVQP